jgi:hypothetical protein
MKLGTVSEWSGHQEFGYRFRHYIMACTCGPLVYVRSLKTASTFFYHNLVQHYGWQEINFNDVDWDRQRVISHIIDPVERRHKAFAEYLSMTHNVELFYSNPNFRRMLTTLPLLDVHSTSLHDYFGSRTRNIDWIPLGADAQQNIRITERVLNEHAGVKTHKWDHSFVHASTQEKHQLAQDLRADWQAAMTARDIPEVTMLYLERDISLYRLVQQYFNADGADWEQTSWLDCSQRI